MTHGYYTRITLLEQVGYREWTESLGSDREWFIQGTQAELYAVLQNVAAKHNAFPMAARYDYMLILTSNVSPEAHVELLEVIKKYSKVGVRMVSVCGRTPLEAEAKALTLLSRVSVGSLAYVECPGEELSLIAHLDLNNVTGITKDIGVIKAYHKILELIGRIARIAEQEGGVIQYLGGDNVLVILPTINYIALVERLLVEDDLKAGVGIARTPRESLKLAARALHDIRMDRSRRVVAYATF